MSLMTEKANGAPYELFRSAGWTDEQLIQHGYMRKSCPPPGSPGSEPTGPTKAAHDHVETPRPAFLGVPTPAVIPARVPPANATELAVTEHNPTLNGKDEYEATLENLKHFLNSPDVQAAARIGFDEFRGRLMIAPDGSNRWQLLTEVDIVRLREALGRINDFAPIGSSMMRDVLLLVGEQHKFDSAIVWLNDLVWHGVPRVERFFSTYCGTLDDEYTRAVSRYMWTGLANRVLVPGCQLDMVIAMQSPQGKMKSTGLRCLVPDVDWFTDGLSLHEDNTDFKRLLRGKLVGEISEMAGLSKADINPVKRCITRRREEWVEKFQTIPTVFERRCMFFASTNDERFLPADDTGQRRWLPLEIGELDRDAIARDRQQLWAEGAMLFREHGQLWADAERLAASRHAKHEQSDVWAEKIAEWLESERESMGRVVPAPKNAPFTTGDVLKGAIGMVHERMDGKADKRVAGVLRLLGYERKTVRIEGLTAKRWVQKAPAPPAS